MDLSTHVPLDYNLSQITIALTSGLCLLHRLLGLGGEHAVVGGRPSGPGQGAALTRALVAGAGPGLGGHWLILGLKCCYNLSDAVMRSVTLSDHY